MKIQVRHLTVFLAIIFLAKIGIAQENFATNISKNVSGDEKLLISYDIDPSVDAKSFTVVLILTYEGEQIKASAAYGDVGANVSPGKEKVIVWYYEDDFDGDIGNVKVDVFAYKENEPRAIFEIVSTGNRGYAPCEVVFSNKSTYANEFEWNFGDPGSGPWNLSFEREPTHVYEKGGIYAITLLARNTQSNLENKYYHSIEIKEHKPTIAGFEIKGNNQLAPANVKFRNTSENADTYKWDFGDPSFWRSNESDKKNPSHKYKDPGTYAVKLIVGNNYSGLTDTLVQEVIVEQEVEAEPAFDFTRASETAPSAVTFKNTSENAVRYRWDFGDPASGDANTSEEANPVHIYRNPGTYRVKLSAWSKGGDDPANFSEEVTINELPQPPEARFTIDNNRVLGPATIIFRNTSENADAYSWDFGDPASGNENTSMLKEPAHTYQKPGTYKVVLEASGNGFKNKSRTMQEVVILGGTTSSADFSARFMIENNHSPSPAIIKFTDQSQGAQVYSWNFGDEGSEENSSDLRNPVHIYSKPGRYEVTLTVEDGDGDKSEAFTDVVVITEPAGSDVETDVETDAEPVADPVAQFSFSGLEEPAPVAVGFSNNSMNADSYEWNFGDASAADNSSTEANPSHVYSKPGKYPVILVARNTSTGKEDVVEKTVVVAKAPEPPEAAFEMAFNGETVPLAIDFKNQSVNADAYEWNFGDFDSEENESNAKEPSHIYRVPGEYTISLVAKNSATGESGETSREIRLRSPHSTFVRSKELGRKGRSVDAVVQAGDDKLVAFITGDDQESEVFVLNGEGKVEKEKKLDYHVYDVIQDEKEEAIIMVGVDGDERLILQHLSNDLNLRDPVFFQVQKDFKTDFATPALALSRTNEIGVVANTLNDRYPIDILFQKADKSGRIISLIDRTFKYVGTKLVKDLVPTRDGGFALTGYWQEDDRSPWLILFGKIDRRGHGEMHLIRSEMNILGCSIEESYQDGFAILRAREGVDNKDLYELSFILIDSKGGPTDCATSLPCSIKKEDILTYNPRMIKEKGGYLIASHGFNGMDYDISLFWIDTTGHILKRYEVLQIPGDQFVKDLSPLEGGGYLISGTQRVDGGQQALVIKTDPFGKLNPAD